MIIKQEIYDGRLLQDRFAYTFFKNRVARLGNIIAFRAPMKVEEAFMVDKEDLINKDFIYSEDAINFCIEIPDVDLFGGVCFQRLFNSHIGTVLADKYLKVPIEIDGDDILVYKHPVDSTPSPAQDPEKPEDKYTNKGKVSVSIAKQVNGAVLIHTGINIKAGKEAPDFAFDSNLTDEQVEEFMIKACEIFYILAHDIFVSTTKVVK